MAERIGRFELLETLGSGAMGVVWRARDTRLRREVALKLIREEHSADAAVRERFIREFHTAASLNHPAIATLYEADETPDGRVYCVYEKVDGETLTERIERGALPADEILDVGLQLAEALAAAHRAGVVHRDIKPDNLMLTPEGRLKVLDFGLARIDRPEPTPHPDAPAREAADPDATVDETRRTRAGALVGTPRYMSPEQASGLPVDARTDVFSAGLVLYELATGEAAFRGDSVPETLHRIQADRHRSLIEHDRSIHRGLARVVDRALAKSPGERYASGAELAEALSDAARPPARRRLWIPATIVFVGLLAAAVWLATRPSLAFSDRDRLLIADVDNRTGEELFDLALTAAIEGDIEQSRYARVFDRARVGEMLQMLRRPPDATIDEELGRDICRIAGIRALVVPRILAVGNAYEVQATVVDPVSGRRVETIRVTADGREAVLLEAVDELARKLRRSLGESLASIESTDLPVSRHTTTSLEALRALTLADRRWQEGEYREAALLFERAIELDPEFMAAHGSLGLLKIQFLGEPEEGKRMLRRALELTDGVTDVERLMVGAVNKHFVDQDLDAALADYEVILDLFPGYFAAANNRAQVFYQKGRYPEALAAFGEAHEAEPKSAFPLWAMARIQLFLMRDAPASESTMRKVVELYPESADALHMVAYGQIAAGRFEAAEKTLREVLELDSKHVLGFPNLAHTLMRLGRAAEAVPLYREVRDIESMNRSPGQITWNDLCLALALQAVGETAEAERLLVERLEALPAGSVQERLDRAQVEAAVGRREEAVASVADLDPLTLDVEDLSNLAQVMALAGKREEALAALEAAEAGGYQDVFFWTIMPTLASLHDDPRLLALTSPKSRP